MALVRCYSKRLLNPYLGTVQVLEMERARAISTDGHNWRIQILSEIFQQPWSSLAIPASYDRYFLYGNWSRNEGLGRIPVHPTLYAEHVEQHAQNLVNELSRQLDRLPFPPEDRFECWLLDPQRHPVVMIRSTGTEDNETSKFPSHLRWSCCTLNETFESGAVEQQRSNGDLPGLARDILNRQVAERLGDHPLAIWFDRKNNEIININHSGIAATDISMQHRPDLLITCHWQNQEKNKLISDYLAWLSPRLLCLHDINNELRNQLESSAEKYPFSVERLYRLYPAILDRQRLNKILVEARLRKATRREAFPQR